MKRPKSPRIQHLSDQMKLDLERIITNPKDEANGQELSIWQIYAYCDREKQTDYPLFRILSSPYGEQILTYLHNKLLQLNNLKINGRIDDDWARLTKAFGEAYGFFVEGKAIPIKLFSEMYMCLDTIVAEGKKKNS